MTITPSVDEAERCTQVGLMYAGRLIAGGTPAHITAMVPGHMLELTPVDLGAASRLAAALPGVLEVQTYGDKLHIFVDDVAQRRPHIQAALASHGIAHDAVREVEVRMEEAFISLIRRQVERQVA